MKRVIGICFLALCMLFSSGIALAEDGEQSQQRQADVRQIVAEKAQEPLVS